VTIQTTRKSFLFQLLDNIVLSMPIRCKDVIKNEVTKLCFRELRKVYGYSYANSNRTNQQPLVSSDRYLNLSENIMLE
jgi:hypothetical protein